MIIQELLASSPAFMVNLFYLSVGLIATMGVAIVLILSNQEEEQ